METNPPRLTGIDTPGAKPQPDLDFVEARDGIGAISTALTDEGMSIAHCNRGLKKSNLPPKKFQNKWKQKRSIR